MADFRTDWDDSYTTQVDDPIADGNDLCTEAIDNNGKWGSEVTVTVEHGGTANCGVKVYVLRQVDTTTYEDMHSDPWGFEMPYDTNQTVYRTFFVDGVSVSKFKVFISNSSGGSVDVTVKTKQLDAIVSS